MARISKEQRGYIQNAFFLALTEKVNSSIPKDLLNKKAKVSFSGTSEMSITLAAPSRWHRCEPELRSKTSGKVLTHKNVTSRRMEDAVKNAKKISERGMALWEKIEAEMVLGSDDIKKVLADALAKVAKL
jgi:hypothetical protein